MIDRTQIEVGARYEVGQTTKAKRGKLCTFIRVENNGCWDIFKSDDGSRIEVSNQSLERSSAELEKTDDHGRTQHHRLRCEVQPVESPSMFTAAVLKDEVKTK